METTFNKIISQHEILMMHYQAIEGLPDWPLNLEQKPNQKLIKDFLYRMMEELGEAYLELSEVFKAADANSIEAAKSISEKFFQELGDFLNFYFEVIIFIGHSEFYYKQIFDRVAGAEFAEEDLILLLAKQATVTNNQDGFIINYFTAFQFDGKYGKFYINTDILDKVERNMFHIMFCLTQAGHSLKNRDWHTIEKLSSLLEFDEWYIKALAAFMKMMQFLNIGENKLFYIYYDRHLNNLKRINDGY